MRIIVTAIIIILAGLGLWKIIGADEAVKKDNAAKSDQKHEEVNKPPTSIRGLKKTVDKRNSSFDSGHAKSTAGKVAIKTMPILRKTLRKNDERVKKVEESIDKY